MKKITWILTVSIVFSVFFSFPSFAAKKVVKLGHVNSPASIFQFQAVAFKNALEKDLTDWKVEIYPAGQLGGTLALIQGLQLGTVDIYTEFDSCFADIIPENKVFAVHFKFASVDEYEMFMNSVTFRKMNQKMAKQAGIINIGSIDGGSVYNIFSNKPIRNIKDVKGLVNRTAQMAPLVASWKSYGAAPTPMDWGEIYTSLATGVIEAVPNPILDMYDEKFHEGAKYLNMTNHLYNMISYETSYRFWKKLSAMEKDAFKRAIRIASIKSKAEVKRRLDKVINDLKSRGLKIIKTDTTAFKNKIQANIDDILKGKKEPIAIYKKIIAKNY